MEKQNFILLSISIVLVIIIVYLLVEKIKMKVFQKGFDAHAEVTKRQIADFQKATTRKVKLRKERARVLTTYEILFDSALLPFFTANAQYLWASWDALYSELAHFILEEEVNFPPSTNTVVVRSITLKEAEGLEYEFEPLVINEKV